MIYRSSTRDAGSRCKTLPRVSIVVPFLVQLTVELGSCKVTPRKGTTTETAGIAPSIRSPSIDFGFCICGAQVPVFEENLLAVRRAAEAEAFEFSSFRRSCGVCVCMTGLISLVKASRGFSKPRITGFYEHWIEAWQLELML